MAKKWQKKADDEWSRVVRQVGYCEMCGSSTKQLHAHHIIGRANFAYRHDLSNGICLCASCHVFSKNSAHSNATFFYRWLKENRPGQWVWFREHTVEKKKMIGNTESISYAAIKTDHVGNEAEYNILKEM